MSNLKTKQLITHPSWNNGLLDGREVSEAAFSQAAKKRSKTDEKWMLTDGNSCCLLQGRAWFWSREEVKFGSRNLCLKKRNNSSSARDGIKEEWTALIVTSSSKNSAETEIKPDVAAAPTDGRSKQEDDGAVRWRRKTVALTLQTDSYSPHKQR